MACFKDNTQLNIVVAGKCFHSKQKYNTNIKKKRNKETTVSNSTYFHPLYKGTMAFDILAI